MTIVSYVTSSDHAPDLACMCANIALFTTIQCIFFVKIASKQYDLLLQDKLKFLVEFLKNDRYAKRFYCTKLDMLVNVRRWKRVDTASKTIYQPRTQTEKDDIVKAFQEHVASDAEIDVSIEIPPNHTVLVETSTTPVYFERVPNKFDKALMEAERNKKDNISTIMTWCSPFVGIFGILTILFIWRGRSKWEPHHTFGMKLVAACFTTEIFYFFGVFKTFQIVGDWEIANRILLRKLGK